MSRDLHRKEQLDQIVRRRAIPRTKATSMRDMGRVMAECDAADTRGTGGRARPSASSVRVKARVIRTQV